jgi:hypothetical protein
MQQKVSLDGLGSANLVLFEAFQLDLTGGGLFRLDQAGIATPVSISSRALDLLGLLVERQGQLVSKRIDYGSRLARNGGRRRQPHRPCFGVAPHPR